MPWVPVSSASSGYVAPGGNRTTPRGGRRAAPSWKNRQGQSARLQNLGSPTLDDDVQQDVSLDFHSPVSSPQATPNRTENSESWPTNSFKLGSRRKAWADMASDSDTDEDALMNPRLEVTQQPPSASTDVARNDERSCSTAVINRAGHGVDMNASPSADAWVLEVMAMAKRLSTLAPSAPSAGPAKQSVSTSTEITADDVYQWALATSSLRASNDESSKLRATMQHAQTEAQTAERLCSAARVELQTMQAQYVANAAAEQESQRREDVDMNAMMTATAAALASARDSAQRARDDAQKAIVMRCERLVALRAKVDARSGKADEAEAEAVRAADAKQLAQNMPAIKERRRTYEEQATRMATECATLKRNAAQVQSEIDAVSANTRVEAVESRIAQLEQECRELTESVNASSRASGNSELRATGKTELHSKYALVQRDRLEAQDKNARVLAEVWQARADRDKVDLVITELEAEFRAVRDRCALDSSERADLELQYQDLANKEVATQAEIARLREEILESEQRVSGAEDAAKRARERSMEVEQSKQGLKVQRQRAEEQASLLEWRLQKAVAQLDKEKPGAPLAKCLMSSRPMFAQGGSLGNPTYRAPRAKRLGGPSGSGKLGGSDADVESTTAGESAADGLQSLLAIEADSLLPMDVAEQHGM